MVGKDGWRLLVLILSVLFSSLVANATQEQYLLPDLEPRDLVLSPTSPVAEGTVVHVWAEIINDGSAPAGEFVVELSWRRLDKEEVCGINRQTFGGLDVGAECDTEATIDTGELTPGTYEVAVRVDPDDRVEEIDETNNRIQTELVIRSPKPELHPIRLGFDPTSPVEWGETVRIFTELENTGESTAGKFHVRFYLYPVRYTEANMQPETSDSTNETKTGTDKPPVLAPIGHRTTLKEQILAFKVTASDPNDSALALSATNLPLGATFTDNGNSTGDFSWTPTYNQVGSHPNIRFEVSDGLLTDSEEITIKVIAIDRIAKDDWIQFGSVQVPGLERQGHIKLQQALDTAVRLSQLLEAKGLGSIQHRSSATTYAIRVEVDEPSGVKEQDSGNNEIIGYLTIIPSRLNLPELRPVRITFYPDLPLQWDRDLTVTVLVVNTGGRKAGEGKKDIQVSFYYRELGEGKESWESFESETIDELGIEERNNEEEVDGTLEFRDLNLQLGSYEVRVVVDEDNAIKEQNELNNELTAAFSVEGAELHPLSIDLGAAPVHQGNTITVVSQIENTGDKTVKSFTVGFFIDDVRFDTFYYWDPDEYEGLEEDEIAYAQGTLDTTDLPLGSYDEKTGRNEPLQATLRVIVDPDDQIPELDEANNVISTPLVILPPEARHAELYPTQVTLDPPSPVGKGEAVHVSATICNTGSIDAERFQVALSHSYCEHPSSDCQTCSWTPFVPCCDIIDVPNLPRGGKQIVDWWFATTEWSEGRYRIKVSVDPPTGFLEASGDEAATDLWGEVKELDEDNNELEVGLLVGTPVSGLPVGNEANLTIQDLTLSPPSPVDQGKTVQVCVKIANVGRKAAGQFRVSYRYRRGLAGSFSPFAFTRVTGLEAGRVLSLECKEFIPDRGGIYQIKVIVDSEYEVQEQSEADNEYIATLTVVGRMPSRPDLSPKAVRFEPSSSVVQGTEVAICVAVENLGEVAADSFDVSYAISPDIEHPFAIGAIPGLGRGKQDELCRKLTTKDLDPGTYQIRLVVDPDNRIAEQDEENNVLTSVQLTVTTREPPVPAPVLQAEAPVRLLSLDPETGILYAGSQDGKLYVITPGGSSKAGFPFDVKEGILSLALDSGAPRVAYIGTSKGSLHAVSLDTGSAIGEASLGASVQALAVDRHGTIYAGTTGGLVSLPQGWAPNQQPQEFRDNEGNTVGEVRALLVDNLRSAIYAATSRGLLYAFRYDGSLIWQEEINAVPTSMALANAIYIGTKNGKVQVVGFDGKPDWVFIAGHAITAVVVYTDQNDPIYAATEDGSLYALNLDGTVLWEFKDADTIHSIPTVDDRTQMVFVGSSDGRLYAVNSSGTKEFSSISINSDIRSNIVVMERKMAMKQLVQSVYFGTEGNKIYVIQTEL